MDKDPATFYDDETKRTLNPKNWVKLYADYLYSYALSRLNDEELARDLVQDTFLSALEKIASFKSESTEKTWLTAIVKYKIIDVYRRQSNGLTVKMEGRFAYEEDEYFDTELNHWKEEHFPAPFGVENDDPLQNKEFMSTLESCLTKLPPLWNSVFKRKHIEEESTDEICKTLHISANNFWVIIHRAKVNLRSCLQKNWIQYE